MLAYPLKTLRFDAQKRTVAAGAGPLDRVVFSKEPFAEVGPDEVLVVRGVRLFFNEDQTGQEPSLYFLRKRAYSQNDFLGTLDGMPADLKAITTPQFAGGEQEFIADLPGQGQWLAGCNGWWSMVYLQPDATNERTFWLRIDYSILKTTGGSGDVVR